MKIGKYKQQYIAIISITLVDLRYQALTTDRATFKPVRIIYIYLRKMGNQSDGMKISGDENTQVCKRRISFFKSFNIKSINEMFHSIMHAPC